MSIGLDIAALPTHEQKLEYAMQRVKELEAFKASMSAPKKPDGAFEFLYQNEPLGELTVHYMPEHGYVLAVYLCSKDIFELLNDDVVDDMCKAGAMAYAKHCEDINTDLAIERRHG